MDVNNVTDYMQYEMMAQMLKQFSGDSSSSSSFDVMLECMMKAMEKSNTTISDISSYISKGLCENQTSGSQNGSNDASISTDIEKAVDTASKKYNVDKSLIMEVIKQESSFVPNATSKAGAMGLMQLMPSTAEELGVQDPYSIEENIDGGTKYLSSLLEMYGNTKELALSAYNAGSGTLKKYGINSADQITKLPSETQDYVKKIMKSYGK